MTKLEQPLNELIQAARHGSREAFGEIVARERNALVMSARALSTDWHHAEDAVQDALVAAFRALPGLRDPSRFRPWLMRILVRTALERRRRAARSVALADPARIPARPTGGDPRLDALVDEVERLSEKYRVLISLHYLAGLSYLQIADALGIPEKRVKSRLYDARAALRRRLCDVDE